VRGAGLERWEDFIIDRLEIEHENPWLRDAVPGPLLQFFRGGFIKLELYAGQDSAVLDSLFHLLMVRVNRAVRSSISRAEILRIVEEELASATKGPARMVHLHGWVRQKYDVPADHEVDWSEHFDHETLRVPPPGVWQDTLLPELLALRRLLDGHGGERSILLRTRAPISAGLAFGHAFPETVGYTISVEQPSPGAPGGSQIWRADRIGATEGVLEVREAEGGSAEGDEVAIAIGITDDPRPRVERFLAGTRLKVKATAFLYPRSGASSTMVTAGTVGTVSVALKQEMRRFADRHAARLIHLFYFGPLGRAVLLGQRLNGLGDIQCYERSKTEEYVRSCRLPA